MNKLKSTCLLACTGLILAIAGGLVFQPAALAVQEGSLPSYSSTQEQASADGEVVFNTKYPSLSASADGSFEYVIELQYKGGRAPRVFDLRANVPAGFTYAIQQQYGSGSEIAAIKLDPEAFSPESVKLTVRSFIWLRPDPGEYTVVLEAISGELKNSIQLKAIVTARPALELTTSSGRLNAEATAGKDNYFSITVTNTGTSELQNITFKSSIRGSPPGWNVTFDPKELSSLPLNSTRDIQVNIKPAPKTIAGDYMVTISSEAKDKGAFDDIEIRVTVLTPTIWGWVGVGIVVLVVAGLAVMFMRLGRR